jgi:hypothetical protein
MRTSDTGLLALKAAHCKNGYWVVEMRVSGISLFLGPVHSVMDSDILEECIVLARPD